MRMLDKTIKLNESKNSRFGILAIGLLLYSNHVCIILHVLIYYIYFKSIVSQFSLYENKYLSKI